jgi:hypothetical protein
MRLASTVSFAVAGFLLACLSPGPALDPVRRTGRHRQIADFKFRSVPQRGPEVAANFAGCWFGPYLSGICPRCPLANHLPQARRPDR